VIDSFASPTPLSEHVTDDLQVEGQGSRHVFVLDVAETPSATHDELRLVRTRPWLQDVVATYEIDVEIFAPRVGVSENQMRLVA
jgi:hypothetical protein